MCKVAFLLIRPIVVFYRSRCLRRLALYDFIWLNVYIIYVKMSMRRRIEAVRPHELWSSLSEHNIHVL